jgi:Ca2+-transporting ATPase
MTAAEAAATRTVGLTSAEAQARLETFGPNRVPPPRPTPIWRRVVAQLRDPLMVVLIVAAALTVATGDHPDAVIIALVIVANSAVGIVQEVRADHAVAALRELTSPSARVVRDGRTVHVETDVLVPGDVIVLGEGDIVPADASLVEAAALLVDESALTGESVAVAKSVAADGDGAIAAGTVVVHGRGLAVVTRTGAHSAMGRIAAAMAAPPTLTPLQRRLAGLGRTLAAVAAGLCLVVMTVGLVRGQPAELMVVTAISLVVAAVPESLPAVVTLGLALGARRMAKRHAIVRRLPAVETLGSVTVIATDKTGTLTQGEMVVESLWTPYGDATVTGSGYSPAGAVTDDNGPVTRRSAPHVVDLLVAGALCNDAALQPPQAADERWRAAGDPTEAALLAAAARAGIDVGRQQQDNPRLAEVPFDSDRRRMLTVHRHAERDVVVICKGAPEVVLTSTVLGEPPDVVSAARARAEAFALAGYRVLAIAATRRGDLPHDARTADHDLSLLGLVAIADPPRPDAAATVAACRAAGIIPVLITGDHVATARSIAERLGILEPGDVTATGQQLKAGEVPDPTRVTVFARTDPTQKLDIVRAWQDRGHVIAMTGDGVNDGPALRRADIGVAMGRQGTEIARQAADLVLTDDDLATVVAATEEGRRVYANVRRFLLYGLAGGTAEIVVMLLGPIFGLALPLLPAQILWVNLLTHGLPGVALGAEPSEPDVMRRGPRPPAESVIGDGLWRRVLALGLVVTVLSLGVGVWAHHAGRPWQSMLFLALATAQFGVALGVRARPGTWTNPFLLVAVAAALVLQLAGLYLPPLQSLLDTESLSAGQVAAVSLVAVASYLATRLVRERPRVPDSLP